MNARSLTNAIRGTIENYLALKRSSLFHPSDNGIQRIELVQNVLQALPISDIHQKPSDWINFVFFVAEIEKQDDSTRGVKPFFATDDSAFLRMMKTIRTLVIDEFSNSNELSKVLDSVKETMRIKMKNLSNTIKIWDATPTPPAVQAVKDELGKYTDKYNALLPVRGYYKKPDQETNITKEMVDQFTQLILSPKTFPIVKVGIFSNLDASEPPANTTTELQKSTLKGFVGFRG